MPHLQKIYDKYRSSGFTMVSINTVPQQAEMIPEWRTKNKFTFPILVGMTDTVLREKYRYEASPTNMLVGGEGKVLFTHIGYGPGAEKVLEAEIREMLGLDPFAGIDFKEAKKETTTGSN